MDKWHGKVALVTGASSGIGAAVLVSLANHGMRVIGCSRHPQSIEVISNVVNAFRFTYLFYLSMLIMLLFWESHIGSMIMLLHDHPEPASI